MCGIIGYVGLDDAKKELLKGLQALEYRGYDSAGIAYCQPNGIKTIKTVGKVSCLKDKVAKEAADDVTTCGIGHPLGNTWWRIGYKLPSSHCRKSHFDS